MSIRQQEIKQFLKLTNYVSRIQFNFHKRFQDLIANALARVNIMSLTKCFV